MSKALNVALGIGIAIVLVLVVTLGIKTFYPGPEYEDFCADNIYSIDNEVNCVSAGGKWEQGPESEAIGRCDNTSCREEYDLARDNYGRNVFFISNILGILFVVISLFLMKMMNISAGVAFSGIALVVYGFMVGWEGTDDVWKFLVGVVIAILLIISAVLVNKKLDKK